VNCTFINFASDKSCQICGYGREGRLVVPPNKWMCDPTSGGCTFFNDNTNFYCQQCDRSRPDLASVRF
jgi:hypothetical protein